jgi:hypothetical protein
MVPPPGGAAEEGWQRMRPASAIFMGLALEVSLIAICNPFEASHGGTLAWISIAGIFLALSLIYHERGW